MRKEAGMLDSLPPAGAGGVIGAAITALGMLALGLVRALTARDETETKAARDMQRQISDFTLHLQEQLRQEREHCEVRLQDQERLNAERLAARDRIIERMEKRIAHLEQNA